MKDKLQQAVLDHINTLSKEDKENSFIVTLESQNEYLQATTDLLQAGLNRLDIALELACTYLTQLMSEHNIKYGTFDMDFFTETNRKIPKDTGNFDGTVQILVDYFKYKAGEVQKK